MSMVRVLVTSKQTLTQRFYSDGQLVNTDSGPVTVTVKKLDGTTVQSGSATNAGTGVYTFSPSPSAVVDTWTIDWSGLFAGATVVRRDYIEHVGGFFFGLREAITRQGLSTDRYSIEDIAQFRIYVEQTCEQICRRAFVSRHGYEEIPGSGSSYLRTANTELRVLRSLSVGGTAFTQPQLDAVQLRPYGSLIMQGGTWPLGALINMEYEHGWNTPPEPIRQAAMTHLKVVLTEPKTAIPDRASSYVSGDASYRLVVPDTDTTGIPTVDGVYLKYRYGRSAVFA